MRSVETSSGRGSIPRARSRSSRPTLPRSTCRRSSSVIAAMSPIVSIPSRTSRSSARGPTPGRIRIGKRREERRLAAGADDRQPAGLAPVGGHLRDDLRRRDAERARELCARPHDRLDRLGDRARVVERRARPRRGRGSPRRSRPAPRSARSRGSSTRPHVSSRGRASAAGGRTRRGGSGGAPPRPTSPSGSRSPGRRSCTSRRLPGRAGRRRRSAALGVRLVLQLLDGGEERVQVEVRDDHERRRRYACGGAGRGEAGGIMPWWLAS